MPLSSQTTGIRTFLHTLFSKETRLRLSFAVDLSPEILLVDFGMFAKMSAESKTHRLIRWDNHPHHNRRKS